VQASFFDKRITIGPTTCKLAIWDTAGQERFHALGPIYYRDADAAILVYDITDQDSFVKVQNWIRELRRMVGHDIVLVIAGNKCDMERQRQVAREDAQAYAAAQGAYLYETSAKLNIGIDDLFLDLATRARDRVMRSGGHAIRAYPTRPLALPHLGTHACRAAQDWSR